MQYSDKGYLRPNFPTKPSDELEDAILEVCPGINLEGADKSDSKHIIWGPIEECYTGFARDDRLRYSGSSGGGLSAILGYMLASDQADTVVQIVADEKHPSQNSRQESQALEDIIKAAGSRYSPAAPLAQIMQVIERYDRVVVVGKPCDIAGLSNLIKFKPEISKHIVLKLAFMCGGTPSQFGTDEILDHLGVKHNELERFRYRGEGWPGTVQAERADGSCETMSYADSWGNILSKQIQFRCKICPDATGAFSDLTFADAWYGDDKGYPSFEEQAGRSLILARTARGQGILREAVAAEAVEISPLDVSEIEKMQPYQARRKRLIISRLMAMMVFGRRRPSFRKLDLMQAMFQESIMQNARSFLGLLRRLIKRRA
jgi:coenzyme F420 hydrogenase subunit beta